MLNNTPVGMHELSTSELNQVAGGTSGRVYTEFTRDSNGAVTGVERVRAG